MIIRKKPTPPPWRVDRHFNIYGPPGHGVLAFVIHEQDAILMSRVHRYHAALVKLSEAHSMETACIALDALKGD